MNEVVHLAPRESRDRAREAIVDYAPGGRAKLRPEQQRRWGGRLLGLGVTLMLAGALGFGGWRYYVQQHDARVIAEQRRDFVPSVRVATVRASEPTTSATLPATTLAFTSANIYARASGYIVERKVDIGDPVKQRRSEEHTSELQSLRHLV